MPAAAPASPSPEPAGCSWPARCVRDGALPAGGPPSPILLPAALPSFTCSGREQAGTALASMPGSSCATNVRKPQSVCSPQPRAGGPAGVGGYLRRYVTRDSRGVCCFCRAAAWHAWPGPGAKGPGQRSSQAGGPTLRAVWAAGEGPTARCALLHRTTPRRKQPARMRFLLDATRSAADSATHPRLLAHTPALRRSNLQSRLPGHRPTLPT